jgi:hypothetical protein
MPTDPPDIGQYVSVGRERLNQLARVHAAPPESFLAELAKLPWVRFTSDLGTPDDLDVRRGFAPSLLELVILLEELATNQRGPGILGYFTHLELSASMRGLDASYRPASRVVSLSLGLPMLANELEITYRWLDSVLFGGRNAMSLDELRQLQAPADVREELAALYRAAGTGELAVTGKHGGAHPIGRALLQFVLAHELAHMVDFAESPRLQASWRDTVWADYQDALDYCVDAGAIDRVRYQRFLRSSLDARVANQWATELLADGLGFHILSRIPPSGGVTRERAHALLQCAVEVLFRVLMLAYRGDVGSDTHPPPTLRSHVMHARLRKDHRMSWSQFLSERWGAGLATSYLLDTTLPALGGQP